MVPNFEEDLSRLPSEELGAKSFIQPKTIPSLDEELATQLWEEVRKKLKAKDEDKKPPLSVIAHTKVGYELHDDILSRQNKDKSDGAASEDPMLKMLPKYVGEYESVSEIVPLPIPNIPIHEPKKDVANLQALMSTPVTCTIPLAHLLNIIPNLWERSLDFQRSKNFAPNITLRPKIYKRNQTRGQESSYPCQLTRSLYKPRRMS